MTGYLAGLIAVSSLVGICSYLSFGEGDGFMRTATSLILVYVVISPFLTLVNESEELRPYDFKIEDFESTLDDTQFGKNAEEAFADGVRRAVSEHFMLSENNVRVVLIEFDSNNMRAEKIKILLSGKAVLADSRAIASYVYESGLGECEVELSVE